MQNNLKFENKAAIVVKPAVACVMLGCGHTRFYELLAKGELQSYRDGASRKVTIESIHSYIARRLALASAAQGAVGVASDLDPLFPRETRQEK